MGLTLSTRRARLIRLDALRMRFLTSPLMWVDLAAMLPTLLEMLLQACLHKQLRGMFEGFQGFPSASCHVIHVCDLLLPTPGSSASLHFSEVRHLPQPHLAALPAAAGRDPPGRRRRRPLRLRDIPGPSEAAFRVPSSVIKSGELNSGRKERWKAGPCRSRCTPCGRGHPFGSLPRGLRHRRHQAAGGCQLQPRPQLVA